MKLNFLYVLFSCLVLPLLLQGCRSDAGDCFKSTGKIIREERSIPAITGIHIRDNVHIVLTADSSGNVYVEAGENLLSKINTRVEGSMLMISNDNTCNWVRSYKKLIRIYIGVKNLKDIFHYGYGDIETEGFLNKDTLFVHHYSSGNVHLRMHGKLLWMDMDRLGDFTAEGSVQDFIAYTYNLGRLRAENFTAQNAYIINEGQGDAYVRSSGILRATLKDQGNIYYFGNPSDIAQYKTGSGNLIKGD